MYRIIFNKVRIREVLLVYLLIDVESKMIEEKSSEFEKEFNKLMISILNEIN